MFDAFAMFILRFQHILYYIVLSFARFNLYALSYGFLFKRAFEGQKSRGGKWTYYLEVVALTLFWAWYGGLLVLTGNWKTAIGFLVVSNMVPSPLHVQVCNHKSVPFT